MTQNLLNLQTPPLLHPHCQRHAMAVPNLFHLKHPPKPLLHPLNPQLQNLNPNPNPNPSLSFSSLRLAKKPSKNLTCSATSPAQGDHGQDRARHPRPQEIQWSKELANTVHLIGLVGSPVQMKQLPSGKVLAWTGLAVKKSASDSSWVNLTFWDELAHVAFQHVEKGQQVYVSGRLVSDTVEGEDEKRQVYYKVVVQKLNFIEKSYPAVSLYDPEANSMGSGGKFRNNAGNSSGSTEELWQAFFANPVDWWDNRRNKRNPKYPDFKHKDTGEALWIEGRFNPPWVKSQLAILDTRMGSLQTNETSAGSFMHADELTSFF